MDEPFSSLDALTRETLQDTLARIWSESELTIVLVTHSIEEAVFLGQSILVMSNRPGSVKAIIDNNDAGRPGYRDDPSFHSVCKQVRRLLEN
jgi:NitT/TauT family transport system ATP-binding protein